MVLLKEKKLTQEKAQCIGGGMIVNGAIVITTLVTTACLVIDKFLEFKSSTSTTPHEKLPQKYKLYFYEQIEENKNIILS